MPPKNVSHCAAVLVNHRWHKNKSRATTMKVMRAQGKAMDRMHTKRVIKKSFKKGKKAMIKGYANYIKDKVVKQSTPKKSMRALMAMAAQQKAA